MLLGFAGLAGSGKNTAANFLEGFTQVAFADSMRKALLTLNPLVTCESRVADLVSMHGWDVAKRQWPEIRALLQRLGTEVGREMFGENFWVDMLISKLDPTKNYVVTDVRFPNEVWAIQNAGGHVYFIHREGIEPMNHASENISAILDLCDGHLYNDGTLEDLKQEVCKSLSFLR